MVVVAGLQVRGQMAEDVFLKPGKENGMALIAAKVVEQLKQGFPWLAFAENGFRQADAGRAGVIEQYSVIQG